MKSIASSFTFLIKITFRKLFFIKTDKWIFNWPNCELEKCTMTSTSKTLSMVVAQWCSGGRLNFLRFSEDIKSLACPKVKKKSFGIRKSRRKENSDFKLYTTRCQGPNRRHYFNFQIKVSPLALHPNSFCLKKLNHDWIKKRVFEEKYDITAKTGAHGCITIWCWHWIDI